MIDTLGLFIAWQLQNAALTDLVTFAVDGEDPRPLICGGKLPEKFDPENHGHRAVTIRRRGGMTHPEQPISTVSIQVTAWAMTSADAQEVYGALFDGAHGANSIDLGAAGFVLACMSEVDGQDVTDPENGWETVVGFFSLTSRPPA